MMELETGVNLEVRRSKIRNSLQEVFIDVPLPVDRDHHFALLRYFQRQKNWRKWYKLKETVPDLRPRDATTVHKAQGSSYDTAFIDVGDLSGCRHPDTAARLLYVCFSRATSRVILYGDLDEKYGGLQD